MHISEGILPIGWAALWMAIAAPFMAVGLREIKLKGREDTSFKPLLGLMAAMVFIISCMPIPVPLAGTCSHPCGTGLAALLLGPALTVVIASISLLFQALFLAHGGLTTLGANVCSLGVAGAYTAIGVYRLARAAGTSRPVAAFMAGLISDWATYLVTSLELAGALGVGSASFWTMFKAIALAFVPTQLPLGILECFVTAGALKFMLSRKPSLASIMAEKGVS